MAPQAAAPGEMNPDWADEGTQFERPGPATQAEMAQRRGAQRIPSRSASDRAGQLRQAMGGEFRGILHIDASEIPRGWSMEWKVESVYGQPNREGLRQNMQYGGWTPVLASEMPNYASPMLPGDTEVDTFIRRGGQILMKRPLEHTQDKIAAQREQTASDIAMLDRNRAQEVRSSTDNKFQPISEQRDGFVSRAPKAAGRFADA